MVRCGVCGSERLGPLGELMTDSRVGDQRHLSLRFPRPGLLRPRPEYWARQGRACLSCGAVTAFLSPAELRRHRADADQLVEPEQPPD
ncbi:hypothetical protein SAMN05216223_1108 [Actinacidiphila yanglinensis]|uniref:Uncharacterized protein n=1 Tax=Actinacidiphila yanglinensis TaxID=310779 RepID=A0A1H6CSI1_9ACTN|nr:hypothetical protein [Actinacidiphila yanglinensis]SEG75737.1 hypothetical protein SAMN05216223_1108 [Actinacidiphila yanglinensis]